MLDEPMQPKICQPLRILETKHDLVAPAKKLRPKQDGKPKPCLPTPSCPSLSTSAQPEQSDAFGCQLFALTQP